MSENFAIERPVSENIQDVDAFFDNIPDCEDDFTFLQDKNSFETARLLLQESTNSSNSENSEEGEDDSVTQSIATESTERENDMPIPQITEKACLTSCAVVDIADGKIKCCGKTENLRRLWQLIGMWQLDKSTVESVDGNLDKLGICYNHFMFDQNKLHSEGIKKSKSVSESLIHHRRCRYCGINYYFFSRGKFCAEHSWKLLGKHVQIPCTGQKNCKALEEFESIIIKSQSNYKARYICCECYEKEGGHLYVRPGRGNDESSCHLEGKHEQDLVNSLELINKWVKWVILSNNTQLQLKILNLIVPALQNLNSENDTLHDTFIKSPPSLFSIRTIFKLYKININNSNLTSKECLQIGSNLAENLEKSRKEFKNFQSLESTNSLDEYQLALPKPIYSLFEGMVGILLKNKRKVANKKQITRKKPIKPVNQIKIKKISTFLTSIIFSLSQKKIKIWLPTILTSLCRKPRLSSSLHQVLQSVNVIAHTDRHERRLENKRMSAADPTLRLFGPNQFANETLIGFQLLISQLLNCKRKENNLIEYSCEFDSDTVNTKIIEQINIGVQCLPPHIVILEAGGNPNNNEDIFATCEKYIEDLELTEEQPVEICCDEAIFRRVLKLHQKKSNFRPLLGQWHTSKDMCSVLLTIFSSYGIYNLAVKVWYCFYKWCGWWKAHRGGIRTGNTNTQLKCLAAFAPLFPAGGKLNYTKSTVHFLALLSKYPRLKELLHYAGSVNLTSEGHYYAFDEALEILAEFIGDNVTSHGKHSVDNRNIALWNLIKILVEAFGSVAPLKHPLFKNNNQLNNEGCQKLFKCYDSGLERLKKIYRQEILQIETINTKGRRAKEVVVSKVKDIKKAEKEAEKAAKSSGKQPLISTQKEESNIILPEQLSSPFEEIVLDTDIEHVSGLSKNQKVTRHRTIQQEKDLLAPLLTSSPPTEEEVEEVLKALLQFWDGWTKKKVRDYWSHHKPKK